MRLNGLNILITAAGQGIGRASALAAAAEGANVYATDINSEALASLSRENSSIRTSRLDVTKQAEIDALAAELPKLDGLFNCAGVVHNGTVLDIADADWAFAFDLNVTAMMRMCRAFCAGHAGAGRGDRHRIGAEHGFHGILDQGICQSCILRRHEGRRHRADQVHCSRLCQAGLRCNALCPGTVDTPSLRGRIAASADPAQAEKDFIARQPMGRLATVDDITPMVIYLLSPESRFVSGQALLVDGGVTI